MILMLPMGVMKEGRRIQTALEAAGEEVSQYAYVLQQLKLGEEVHAKEIDGFSDEFLEGLTEEGILLFVRKRVEGRAGFKRLESASFARSTVLADGETIDLIMDYRVRIPFSVFGLSSIPMTARCCRRAGSARREAAAERMERRMSLYTLERRVQDTTANGPAITYTII